MAIYLLLAVRSNVVEYNKQPCIRQIPKVIGCRFINTEFDATFVLLSSSISTYRRHILYVNGPISMSLGSNTVDQRLIN